MSDVTIAPLHLIGAGEKGNTYDFSLSSREDFIFITRKAGSQNGNTYHKGISDKVNPKCFVLLQGKIEFSYRHIEMDIAQKVLISEPSLIKVSALVTHAILAVTDIMMLECNGIKDIENDRYRLNVVSD